MNRILVVWLALAWVVVHAVAELQVRQLQGTVYDRDGSVLHTFQ
jgi:hypothetical protein